MTDAERITSNNDKIELIAQKLANKAIAVGEIDITENGTYDVTRYASANVNVPIPESDAKLGQVVDGTITELTASDLAGATKITPFKFYYCSSLESIIIPDGVISIGTSAFEKCTSLTNVEIPNSVITFESGVFNGCSNLVHIKIPDSVTDMKGYTFYQCTKLVDVQLPNKLIYVGTSEFYECSSLNDISIPDSVTVIADYSFQKCTSLTRITIPALVTRIGYSAFSGCTNLTEMTILATTPPNLRATSSISSATTTIYIPKGTLSAYQSATNWSAFSDKFVELEV